MDLVIDGVRWVLWILVKGSMFLIDSVYNIIRPILSFDIGSNSTVWQWWDILMMFLLMFTLLRAFTMLLKATIDEEYVWKLSGLRMIFRHRNRFRRCHDSTGDQRIHRFYERRYG